MASGSGSDSEALRQALTQRGACCVIFGPFDKKFAVAVHDGRLRQADLEASIVGLCCHTTSPCQFSHESSCEGLPFISVLNFRADGFSEALFEPGATIRLHCMAARVLNPSPAPVAASLPPLVSDPVASIAVSSSSSTRQPSAPKGSSYECSSEAKAKELHNQLASALAACDDTAGLVEDVRQSSIVQFGDGIFRLRCVCMGDSESKPPLQLRRLSELKKHFTGPHRQAMMKRSASTIPVAPSTKVQKSNSGSRSSAPCEGPQSSTQSESEAAGGAVSVIDLAAAAPMQDQTQCPVPNVSSVCMSALDRIDIDPLFVSDGSECQCDNDDNVPLPTSKEALQTILDSFQPKVFTAMTATQYICSICFGNVKADDKSAGRRPFSVGSSCSLLLANLRAHRDGVKADQLISTHTKLMDEKQQHKILATSTALRKAEARGTESVSDLDSVPVIGTKQTLLSFNAVPARPPPQPGATQAADLSS